MIELPNGGSWDTTLEFHAQTNLAQSFLIDTLVLAVSGDKRVKTKRRKSGGLSLSVMERQGIQMSINVPPFNNGALVKALVSWFSGAETEYTNQIKFIIKKLK